MREVEEEYHLRGHRGLDSCLVEGHPNKVLDNKDKEDNRDNTSDLILHHYSVLDAD